MRTTYLTQLECSQCGKTYSPGVIQTFCPACTKPLVARYDLEAAKNGLSRESLARREGSLWRYRELLPVAEDSAVTALGEGWTPLLSMPKLGAELGLQHLLVKDEGPNPTGSFKARGLALAVSMAKQLGITKMAMPSAGNAGGALAAYAARAGLQSRVYVPADTPAVNIREVALYGGECRLVDGVISDAAKKMAGEIKGTDWFDMSTMKEPYRLEGKKTLGYELAEQLGWRLPDVIVYPTGGGTGLVGMWKAFDELEKLGWAGGRKPRMVAVQAENCAPIVRSFRARARSSEFWEDARTAASGLRVPKAFADTMILDALYGSGGTAVAVTDDELLYDMNHAAELEGVFFCPEGAATISAARRLAKGGFIGPSETVVIFNTGTGYKYTELFLKNR